MTECGTVIEYGTTEKSCVLPSGHDGPHQWGPEVPKAATPDLNWHWSYCPNCGSPIPSRNAAELR